VDIVTLAAIIIVIAFVWYIIEKLPLPSSPLPFKLLLEVLVAIVFIVMLWPRTGLSLPH
jgi:hypothetical protein